MTAQDTTEKRPLWLLMEEKILELGPQAMGGDNLEQSIRKMAADLDKTGYNVSLNGGNLLRLRWAVKEMLKVGKPFLTDFNDALSGLVLDDEVDPHRATTKLIAQVGETWPSMQASDRKGDILQIIEKKKLDLLVDKAKGLSGDEGIRLLIVEGIPSEVVTAVLEISDEKFGQVNAAVEAELAERERVKKLVESKEGESPEDMVKHLINENVADQLILELAGVEASVLETVNKAMEEELAEKKRLEEEEASRKAAEAAGPPLEEIPSDEMLDYIESIREIMEFSDQEKEIRAMCEQSSIPNCIVDVAVTEPDRLDELEEKAEG